MNTLMTLTLASLLLIHPSVSHAVPCGASNFSTILIANDNSAVDSFTHVYCDQRLKYDPNTNQLTATGQIVAPFLYGTDTVVAGPISNDSVAIHKGIPAAATAYPIIFGGPQGQLVLRAKNDTPPEQIELQYGTSHSPHLIVNGNGVLIGSQSPVPLGIGTASPTGDLHINRTSGQARLRITNTTDQQADAGMVMNSDTAGILLTAYGSNSQVANRYGLSTKNMMLLESEPSVTNAPLVIGSQNSSPLVFGTNLTERMRITSDGFVGIGTTTPGNPFSVTTSVNAQTALQAATTATGSGPNYAAALVAETASTGTNYALYARAVGGALGNYAIFSQNGTNYFGARVGVKTTTPTSSLHVAGSVAVAVRTAVGPTTTTLDESDSVLVCNPAAGAVTMTLPGASAAPGRIYRFASKGGASTCTIQTVGGDTIGYGGPTSQLLAQNTVSNRGYTLVSDGSSTWMVY